MLPRFLLACVLPAVAGLPAQAQTINICDRTAQVRAAILDVLDVDGCAAVDSDGMANIHTLSLNAKQLTALRTWDFYGLTGLQYLNLGRNELTTLPDGVFDGLTSLKILWLRNNFLTALPAGVFDDLTNLQELPLDGNRLATLPGRVFDSLTSLDRLWLQDNQLTALPAGAFDGLTNLRWLYLQDNQLTALPAGVFDGLTSLQILWLRNNQLTALPAGVFDDLTGLQELFLSGNRLATLPGRVFDSLTGLQELLLNGNRLATLPGRVFDSLTNLQWLYLSANQLTALPAGVFDGLTSLQRLRLSSNQLTALPNGAFDGLTNLRWLYLSANQLTALPAGVFDGLTSLQRLRLNGNQLTALPNGVFDGLTSLLELWLNHNQLTALPAAPEDKTGAHRVFDGLTSLQVLYLHDNQLTALPDGAFNSLTSLQELYLRDNQLTALPAGVFDSLTRLQELVLSGNRLTALRDGVFDGLAGLRELWLHGNQLTALPGGVFDGLASLQELALSGNRLIALPNGVFDGLTGLRKLWLHGNQLTALPDGVFDGLASLDTLWLNDNCLVGWTRNDPLFAGFSGEVEIRLEGQAGTRLIAAAPLMLSASTNSVRQGFVRVINESVKNNRISIFAFDDGGYAPSPIFIRLDAAQVAHFNSNDLESGNANKRVVGIGSPTQGDWRLDVKTALAVRSAAFVRHSDGLLTAMHDVLPKDSDGRLVAHTFNPGSNANQVSKLRLVNTGAEDASVSIAGVDDQGNEAGPATLTLPAGVSRTLSAFDLENGTEGLTGTLGDGAGKWRLFVDAGSSVVGVVGMSLLEALTGHLTNLSTTGVATGTQERLTAAVPLMLSTYDSMRQGFVRIVNESRESGIVRVFAFDDGGHAPDPFAIQLGARQVVHFNSNDLEHGNVEKGIKAGVGVPLQGDWRLDVESALQVRVLAFVRTADGFLTAMHDVLPREGGRLVAHTFNPGSNANQVSKLRLVNTGAEDADVSIGGVDDQGNNAGPVMLALPAGVSRTLSAVDLENGADGLTGTLGDGAGKWRLFISAGRSVVGMSLLEAVSGHLTNISTAGVAGD